MKHCGRQLILFHVSAKQQVMFWNPAPLVSFVLYILTPRFALERAVEHEKFILTVGSPLPSRVGRKDHPGSRGTARYNTECLIWTARHKGPGKTSDKASATSLPPAVRAKSASGRGLRAHARSAGQVRGNRDKGHLFGAESGPRQEFIAKVSLVWGALGWVLFTTPPGPSQ